MKNIIKDTLILFAITLVAGLGLGLVYNVTANSRAMQEEKTNTIQLCRGLEVSIM